MSGIKCPPILCIQFTHTDELSDTDDDVIINKSRLGTEADQWFPAMYKVRINYSKDTGYSIYDLFADDKYKDRMIRVAIVTLERLNVSSR